MSEEVNTEVVDNNNTSLVAEAPTVTIETPEAALKALENSGVIVGEIGTKISRVPIEKYRASTQKIDRISFINKMVIGVKSHYVDGSGSFICLGKKCCEELGLPSVRYLFPIVVYTTDSDGNISSGKVELKILSAAEDFYKSIVTIGKGMQNTLGGIDKADLLVTCTDDTYQKMTLSPIGPAAWRQSDATVKMVSEKWAQDAEFAFLAIARKVSEAECLKILGLDNSQGNNAHTPKFDASQNQDLSKFFDANK